MKSNARTRSRTKRAAERISGRSDSICRGAVGRCTLTTTSSPVGQRRPVHLADRGRGDRALVEAEERLLDREPELGADHGLDLVERNGRDVVLELAQLGDDVRRDDVGARREQLAELDERRARARPASRAAAVPRSAGGFVRRRAGAARAGSRSRAGSRPDRSRTAGPGCAAATPLPPAQCAHLTRRQDPAGHSPAACGGRSASGRRRRTPRGVGSRPASARAPDPGGAKPALQLASSSLRRCSSCATRSTQVVVLLAPDEAEPARARGRAPRPAAHAEPSCLAPPARQRVAAPRAHLVALDTDAPREVVGELVGAPRP